MAYKGRYKIKNKDKYLGDPNQVIYRSSWERGLMHFCDISPKVLKWGSEVVKIGYYLDLDKKAHRYIVDFAIKFKTGEWYLIEVKPAKETRPPGAIKNKKRLIGAHLIWEKNKAKWEAAKRYCEKRGFHFAVWTEHDLRKIGIQIL